MKIGPLSGIAVAIVLHVAFVLFGGVLFTDPEEDHGTLQEVELLSNEDVAADKEQEEPEQPPEEEIETEEVPDAAEVIRNLELSAAANEPELEAASLNAIEAALSGQAGGDGDFADSLSFASGGRIGGTGKGGGLDEKFDSAFSLAEIDQKPRPIFQASPVYPAQMRGKRLEGVVTVIFIVESNGKVGTRRVEKSNHAAFEKPALDAVKQWKFEPAIKAGQRVACKMRVSVRFPAS